MRCAAGTTVSAILCLVALTALGAACRGEQPLNLLLITLDTTRADRIGCYGHSAIETPHLDRLATDGVRFANAMSPVPITTPSHATILTGRYPLAHGVRDNGLFVLGDEQMTLAELLHDAGYATGAAVGAFPVTAQFGLDQGFELYNDHLNVGFEDHLGNRAAPKHDLFFDERPAARVNEAIAPWLDEQKNRPFFAWVHYFDPHQPFEPQPPFDQLYAHDLYDGEIAYADRCIGYLLGRLERSGALDRTIVVVVGDHGEGLGEHNEVTHAVLAYNSTLHVPLIVRLPPGTGPGGRVVEQRVSTVDVLPTVLDLLEVGAPDGVQGRSLVPLWNDSVRGAAPPAHYAENLSPRLTHGWGELRVLFDGPLKYIHGPRPELFDLAVDPGETNDISAERPADVRRMKALLERFIAESAVAGVSSAQSLDEGVRQRLEALGYLHSSGEVDTEITEQLREGGIAPQDRVGDINDLSAAKHLLYDRRPSDALVYTTKLVQANPTSPMYLELHASALSELGRIEEAWNVVQHLSSLAEAPESLLLRLTAQRFEQGHRDSTVAFLRERTASQPSANSLWLLATISQKLGQTSEAMALLDRALAEDPLFVPARLDRAVLLDQSGRRDEAEREFVRSIEDSPYYAKAHYNFGTFLLRSSRYAQAQGHFHRAVALAPRYLKAHLALVAAHLAAMELDQASAAYAALRQLAPDSEATRTAAELLAEAHATG
jgi:arylsulfatase A-like enzyme/Tfp pilus assembly protein PilF